MKSLGTLFIDKKRTNFFDYQLSLETRLNLGFGGCAKAMQTLPICEADAILTSRLKRKENAYYFKIQYFFLFERNITDLESFSNFAIPFDMNSALT